MLKDLLLLEDGQPDLTGAVAIAIVDGVDATVGRLDGVRVGDQRPVV
jgi:hypothetical protein